MESSGEDLVSPLHYTIFNKKYVLSFSDSFIELFDSALLLPLLLRMKKRFWMRTFGICLKKRIFHLMYIDSDVCSYDFRAVWIP